VSKRPLFSRLFRRKPAATYERAEQVYAQGRHAEAATLLRTVAEQGDARAQLRVAALYERGDGVLQSFVEAERWYRSAAEQDVVAAQARLGEIYLTGLAPPDTATAAAIERIADAQRPGSLLKRLYPQGLAIAQDLAQAADWNQRAARAGAWATSMRAA
jgi:TPR repeat protein